MKREDIFVAILLILGLVLLSGGCIYCVIKVASAFNFSLPVEPQSIFR